MPVRIPKLICKLIQRQTYSCLSTHYGIWFLFCGLCIVLVSAFHFGEVWLQWSAAHYAGNFQFSRYYDNIVGKSFQSRLCLPQPIDVVYTWVNGSDPDLIVQLNTLKEKLRKEVGDSNSGSSTSRATLNSNRFKWKSKIVCPLPNCVPAYKMAFSGLPKDIKKSDLLKINSNFTLARDIETWDDQLLFVSFENRDLIKYLITSPLKYHNVLLNTSEVFYTNIIKNGHRKIDSMLMFYNSDENSTSSEIRNEIESQLPNSVSSLNLYPDVGVGVINFINQAYRVQVKSMSSKRNFTINKRIAKVLPVTYVWLPITATLDDGDGIGSNRFADNEELKYSLRSVEKFAPWVRKIFIVTNGQIPNWLNLNHPRITLITHNDIFLNKSHLPSFSSPAIESNIHRIPGLSKKFIYMNDDVFFGLPVWPDDFYTHSKGHKVFLSWAVPNCHEGCPASWVNDKYCDKACNVSACQWDGGDCLGPKANRKWSLQAQYNSHTKTTGEYCSPGCAHNWLGDRYCDANCNTPLCGFDAADCGLRNLNQLFSYSLDKSLFVGNKTHITAPPGTLSMYFNLSNVFHSILEGNFHDSKILRTAVISKKFKILSLTFFQNVTETTLSFQVLGYKDINKTDKAVALFKLNVSTINIVKTTPGYNRTKHTASLTSMVKVPPKLYNETEYEVGKFQGEDMNIPVADLFNLSLPGETMGKLKQLKLAFEEGDITEYGYNRSQRILYQEYLVNQNEPNIGRKLLWIPGGNEMAGESTSKNPSIAHNIDIDRMLLNDHMKNPHSTIFSFLPWEKTSYIMDVFDIYRKRDILESYKMMEEPRRRLMDAYSSSLLHVGRIYNQEFGFMARKVPAHMPHMVDREIIEEMQAKFWNYFDATSSHKIRHPEDMQFAFSFNYYVISVKGKTNLSEVFEKVDSDHTGLLSQRELRSLAAILYPLPLNLQKIKQMEEKFENCSKRLNVSPLVTKVLFLNCNELWRSLNATFDTNKYSHEIQGEDDVIFKMIRNNASYVLQQLDWIRKNRKKFICLNDDLDHGKESTKSIRGILKDFYESFFPIPSKFELAPKYRNKFGYKWELDDWLKNNNKRNERVNVIIVIAVCILFLGLYRRKIFFLFKRLYRIYSGRGRGRVLTVRGQQEEFRDVYVNDEVQLTIL